MTEGLQLAQMLGPDHRCAGQLLLQGREDFHALDGVDAQIGVQAHGELQHLGGIAGIVGDDGQQDLWHVGGGRPGRRNAGGARISGGRRARG